MKIEHEILINKYGQELVDIEPLLSLFRSFDMGSRKMFLNEIVFLILQSKPEERDIEFAIANSSLKPTFTPCVLLRKGVSNHNLKKLISLPFNELEKVFVLFLSLFKIAYKRRFLVEKNNPDKWWYWDLSDETNINKIP
ncbi:hypothetical protein CJ739_1352 [Mariniflexile rhizosphaerae]|uniref:DUF5958 family protein n=1 Tax=unclassified Mariniflexile TaxID=2643887 RepID=UPI000CACD3E8|nr:DUF5958 family protein [Mariniflexile sp. TRM1-10]AXP80441.1 hypothetical protein CJ739_1352 [Mariniflexile sp. TRM1-10]PLB20537.1 MAG: hypothetical protein TRG1_519 [Flavobacteriaceae bacterium FS1-H7996/R]